MTKKARPAVFSCARLPAHVEAALRDAFNYTQATDDDGPAELSRRASAGAHFDVVLTSIDAQRLDRARIEALPSSIGVIASYSVGLDHVDVEAAAQRGLLVLNTPGTLVDAVADAGMFLILGAARRATENLALIRSGNWPGWHPDQLLGHQLAGRLLGIYGMGEIGRAIADRARGFGMRIAYCNRHPVAGEEALFIADRNELLAQSDVLVLVTPSNESTRGFIDQRSLSRAKSSLILINMARGDVVIDEDLVEALKSGRIFAAGLDVFNGEPKIHPDYLTLPNAFVTPHMGSSTFEARAAMGKRLIQDIEIWFAVAEARWT